MKMKFLIRSSIMRYTSIITGLLLIFILNACDDRFQEVNTNPNGISDVDPAHLFATAARAQFRSGITPYDYQMAGQIGHIFTGVFVERFIDQYEQDLSGSTYESLYNTVYQSLIRYYNEILLLTGPGMEKENAFQYAVADVMAVLSFSKLTDAFGDIPYFNGGLGVIGEMKPAYDSQETIYLDMIERLRMDIETLKQADVSVGLIGQDPIFKDDPELWLRFANSLRLRLAMRMRHVEPATAAEIITECLAEPLLTSNLHNAVQLGIEGDNSQLFSPWYGSFSYYNFRISDRVVTRLESTNDPRLPIYATQISDSTYKGFQNGLVEEVFSEEIQLEHSFPGEHLVGQGAPTYLMTAAEITFLQAECALFSLGGTDADTHYRNGIRLAMQRVGVAPEDIAAFLETETASLSGTQEEQFEQICEQMWLAFIPNTAEAYAMMRRTGYPHIPERDGIVTDRGDTEGELPSRLIYPLSEKQRNTENVQKAINDLPGGDELKSRVWWDVRR
jgi:hypothetical protein